MLQKWHCLHIWHCIHCINGIVRIFGIVSQNKWHCAHNWHCVNFINGIVCKIGIAYTIGIVCTLWQCPPPLTPHPTLCLQVCPSYLRLFRWLIEESASVAQPDTDMGLSVSLACVTWRGARPRGRLVLAAVKIASVKYPWVDRNCCLHTSQRSESLYTSWSLCRYKSCH